MVELLKIRNIGLMAHIDAGKTTTTERILYYTGRIHRMGEVDDGSATMDWMKEERERGITITSAVTTCFWNDHQINIVDTPGHVDFTIEVIRSIRVLDGAIIVLCGVGGVEPQTESVWMYADRYKVPRIVFVNKMDRIASDFQRAVSMIRSKLGANPCPISYPYGSGSSLRGVVDIIEKKLYIYKQETLGAEYERMDIPPDEMPRAEEYYQDMIEMLAEFDDRLLNYYLDGDTPPVELIHSTMRKATIEGAIVPVLAGSALKNVGVQKLLDAVVNYFPSPLDLPPITGISPKSKAEVKRPPSPDAPFSALVFKVSADPFVDRLVYIRLYSGSLRIGKQVFNTRLGKKERILKIFRMHANRREELSSVLAGDIVAVAGLKLSRTGDALSDPDSPVFFEGVGAPEPVIYEAIEPESQTDQEKLQRVLNLIADEDPSFRVSIDDESGQTLIHGMGELHLEVVTHRIIDEFGLPVRVGSPQVAYREGILSFGSESFTFKRELAEKLFFARASVNVSPYQGVEISIRPALPPQVEECVRSSLTGALACGPIAGFPVINVRIQLEGLEYDMANPNLMAISSAVSAACEGAIRNAGPVILEPIMELELTLPEEFIGEVIADLNQRRARVSALDNVIEGISRIRAFIPLAESFGYSTALRSLTRGKGRFMMEFSAYQQLPGELQRKLFEPLPTSE